MSGSVGSINRVSLAIGIRIDTPCTEGAHVVRGVESHQRWGIGPIAITEQVTTGSFSFLPYEPNHPVLSAILSSMTISGVGEALHCPRDI